MKKLIIMLFGISQIFFQDLFAVPKTVDKMLAIIYHPEGDIGIPINQSDLNAGFEGKKPLEAVIFNKHIELDGKMLKVEIAEEDVNRHLAQVQKIYGMTKDDTIKYAKSMGLTYEQFKDELGRGLLRERVMSYRIKGGGINKDEILKYHQDNPVHKENVYSIKQSFVPYGSNSPSLLKIRIEDAVADGSIDQAIKWGNAIELKESQIAEDKKYIKTLETGKSAIVDTTDKGISLMRLEKKDPSRLLTFEEREPEIRNILMQQSQEKAFTNYKNKMYSSSRVKYIK